MKRVLPALIALQLVTTPVLAANPTGRPGSPAEQPTMPRSTQEFIHSIGVGLHLGYDDTVHYSKYDVWKKLLFDSGIKHVRDSVPAAYLGVKSWARDRLAEIGRHGITLMGGIAPNTPVQTVIDDWAALKRSGTDIRMDSVQLGNEPDVFWHDKGDMYKGKGFPDGYRMFIEDYGRALKTNPVSRDLDIIGAAIVHNYQGDIYKNEDFSPFVTQGSIHVYSEGGQSSCNPSQSYGGLSPWRVNYPTSSIYLNNNDTELCSLVDVRNPFYKGLPLVITETGYSTNTAGGGSTELVQAKYIPRTFVEFFRLGFKRTFMYEFLDTFTDPSMKDREAHFGMIRNDMTPKPSYYAVKNLIALLDRPAPTTLKKVDFTFTPQMPGGNYSLPIQMHYLLLQGNDRYYLLYWHEVSNENNQQRNVPLTHPDIPIALSFAQPVSKPEDFRYDAGFAYHGAAQPSGKNFTLKANDTISVFAFSTADVTPTNPSPSTGGSAGSGSGSTGGSGSSPSGNVPGGNGTASGGGQIPAPATPGKQRHIAIEMEKTSVMKYPQARIVEDASASGRTRVDLQHSGGGIAYRFIADHPKVKSLAIRAKGQSCDGPAKMFMRLGTRPWQSVIVDNTDRWRYFPLTGVSAIKKGEDFIVGFPNDAYAPPRCDRNLLLDKFRLLE